MRNNDFYDFEFGSILPDRSTSHALIQLTDMITTAFEKRHFDSGTFLDLSTAFDTLHHNILLSTMG